MEEEKLALPFHFLDGVSRVFAPSGLLELPPSHSLRSSILTLGVCDAWPSNVKANPQSSRNLPLVIFSGDLTLLTSFTEVKD